MRTVIIMGEILLLREGLVQLLNADGRLSVVGSCAGLADAAEALAATPRPVVLLDMASRDAFETIAALREEHPEVRIVALGVAEVDVEMVSCAEAGVSSYVPRSSSVDDLVRCVEGAFDGEVHCSPRLVALLFRRLADLAPGAMGEASGFVQLTRRERQVSELLAEGMTNKEIARTLGIELSTVKNHVHRVLRKMNLRRRVDVATHNVALPRARRATRVPASPHSAA